ncbi:hypothetical protein Moror_10674 [Moniliophthora roreri MCA 2997]|uniref:Uncharacterized protein n=1 Tax=Moniliophthora roreri (strain MCA 2997) TaxID=1381753 RepID=V2WXW3_MONRO|nr:hypothetical protein Moror_10674 [Moniliophthora roreri MCA 2997]
MSVIIPVVDQGLLKSWEVGTGGFCRNVIPHTLYRVFPAMSSADPPDLKIKQLVDAVTGAAVQECWKGV